ncbi:MAG: tRNA lysidine(34) synthetase TilS [Gammaproteobacteria bacterium]|nr:tRNA lysidine(34) synthetase TilS [Gammaproteobacteria bacterium]
MSTSRPEPALVRVRDHLANELAGLRPARFLIAYSGGLDSTVLLHAAAHLRRELAPLCAVHIDHGLQAASASWTAHCQACCEALGVDFISRTVQVDLGGGEGLEAAARRARYGAFAELLRAGDCLLTAHHLDDQAETVLLQLLRGCGPHGLAAMAPIDDFASGLHARPLLAVERDALLDYAHAARLSWIDDPSNSDTRLRRNYLRHDILPRLRRYWPAASRTLARSARHAAAAAALLDERAAEDLTRLQGPQPDMLSVSGIASLSRARADNALRHWLHGLTLPLPGTAQLERIHTEVLPARVDAMPLLAWPGGEIRRYRDWLHAMAPLDPADSRLVLRWEDLRQTLALPGGATLTAQRVRGAGLRADLAPLIVRFRQGGEQCRPASRGHAYPLKQLLQEAGVPPWLRGHVPLIYGVEASDGIPDPAAGPLAVAGLCIAEGCRADTSAEGWQLIWTRGGRSMEIS